MEHLPERPAQPAVRRTTPGTGRENRSTGNVFVPLRCAFAPRCSGGKPSRLSQLLQRARGIRGRKGSAGPSRYGRRVAIRGLTLDPRLTRPVGSPPRLSRRPIDDSRVSGKEHRRTESDSVPGERREVMRGDVAQQPTYAEESGHERSG